MVVPNLAHERQPLPRITRRLILVQRGRHVASALGLLGVAIAGAWSSATPNGGVRGLARATEPEPPSYQCVIEATTPPPPHLIDVCRWDPNRAAWVRPYKGSIVDARSVPRREARMCEWFGCPGRDAFSVPKPQKPQRSFNTTDG